MRNPSATFPILRPLDNAASVVNTVVPESGEQPILHQSLAVRRLVCLKAIISLPSDERKAVILCRVLGYKEESEDPSAVTAAKLCGVTGRTIRNRLSRAEAKLSHLQENL